MDQPLSAISYLNSLRPAIPFSIEKCAVMTNGELRRHMQQNGVLVNGYPLEPGELIDFPVFSLVFFPKSAKRRTTVI